MPDVTAGGGEGVLASWLVGESARFDAAQTIAYVETADELFSVEAGRPGLLLKTLVEPGTAVEPGTPIGLLGEPWEQVEDLEAVLAELGVVRREPVRASSWFDVPDVAAQPAAEEPVREPVRPLVQPLVTPQPLTVVAETEPVGVEAASGAQPATSRPGAHAAVAEPVRQDLVALADPPADPLAAYDPEPVRTPPTPLQHHYLRARVRADRLASLTTGDAGIDALVTRAVTAAHRQVPQLAIAPLEEDRRAAVGIPVSHPGRFGVEEAVAVVPPGQSAALSVGSLRDEPVIDGGVLVPGKVLTLTLSVRPGKVDDAQASRWLAVLVALLERPEWLAE